MVCLDPEQLERLAVGAVESAPAAEFRRHIERCDACREAFEECQANEEVLGRIRQLPAEAGMVGSADPLVGSAHPTGVVSVSDPRESSVIHLAEPPPETIDLRRPSERPVPSGDESGRGGRDARPPRDVPSPSVAIPGYEIVREVHRGGQGVVYEALQRSTKRTVAIKVLLHGPFSGAASIDRFRREVELVAALQHPNIVVIHDSGVAQGNHFFVMDYVPGLPLDDYVRSAGLSARDTIALFARVCSAVAFAHRHGVMHRDLKPSNILVNAEGTPFILDFGLAKALGEPTDRKVSQTGYLLGTLHYMSPEQTLGNPAALDLRTDVYSLGIILYEMLTGALPYDTGSGDILSAVSNIRTAIPPRPSKISRRIRSEIEAIVLKALAKEPDRRYQSADELARDLSAWLEGLPVVAKSASSLYLIRKIAFRHVYVSAILATFLVTILSFSAISFEYYRRAQEALHRQDQADQAVVGANWERQKGVRSAFQLAQRQALGWFLLEWQARRNDEARRIQRGLPANAPERAAMAFLLDPTQTVEQLRTALPASAGPLVDFVVGERMAREGRIEEAVRAFESCAAAADDSFLDARARSRVEQLRSGRRGVP